MAVFLIGAISTDADYIPGGLGVSSILGSGLGYVGNPVIRAPGIPLVAANGGSLLSSSSSLLSAHGLGNPNSRIAPAGVIVPAGHGLEGQYIPSLHEKLYDDGTYKPQVYGA